MRISDWSSDVCSSDLVPLEARQADDQLDVQTEALAVVARADADLGRHPAVLGDLHLLLSGGELDGAEEAGGVAGSKELLGIVAFAARPAELFRRGEGDGEGAVRRFSGTGAAAGGAGFGFVEDFHGFAPCRSEEHTSE